MTFYVGFIERECQSDNSNSACHLVIKIQLYPQPFKINKKQTFKYQTTLPSIKAVFGIVFEIIAFKIIKNDES